MKKTLLFLLLLGLSQAGISQFDPLQYYASSRYDYYTDEVTGQILVHVPELKKGMNVTVDLVLDFNFLNRNAVVFPGHAMPVSFEMGNFKQGNNEVTVSFYEDGKWVDSRKVNVLVRERKSNEVKCDLLTGNLVADGLPFFPVGFYCQWPVVPTLPEEEAVKGFNMMSPYWNIDNKNRKERIKFMDRCARLGMKVNYNICNVAAGGVHTQTLTKDGKLALLKKEVEALRDHPALLSWYLYDEPEGQGVPADSLRASYDLVKSLDPYHPVTIVFMAPHMADQYAHVMDIAMTDPYPVPNGPITQVEEYVEILNGYFRYQKPVWLVPQAFGGNEWWTREPDPREVRAMTYLGLIHNASGVKYFIRKGLNGSPKSQAMWGECGEIAQELMELLPSLAYGQPAPPVIPSRKEIHARAVNRNGLITVMVVNTQNEPTEFDIRLQDIDLVMDVEVVGEGRKVPMQAGVIRDFIDAYGTRLYRVENRMKPDWQKDMKKGNLTQDPGFEDISSPGIPAACYVQPGSDRGATFFLDGRVHKQGEHSLRLVTPVAESGAKLQFFGLELDPDRSYTFSVWAMAARGIPARNSKPMIFNLSLGVDHAAAFELTEEWAEYSLGTAGKPVKASLHRWSMPALELKSAGTAWFDLLQVVPDMEMLHRAKSLGQGAAGEEGRQSGLEIELKSNQPEARITYTLDGTEPTLLSQAYSGPVHLSRSATVKAAAFSKDQLVGTIRKSFSIHRGIGATVKYDQLYEKYDAGGRNGLVDGILATDNYKDGRWQGFHGIDGGILLDLGSAQPVSKVSLRFLQDRSVWIFLPTEVKIMLSQDGITYQAIATTTHEIPLDRHGAMIQEFDAEFSGLTARYIRVEAKSIGNCPEWHSGAGQPGWIFTDEIVVN